MSDLVEAAFDSDQSKRIEENEDKKRKGRENGERNLGRQPGTQ